MSTQKISVNLLGSVVLRAQPCDEHAGIPHPDHPDPNPNGWRHDCEACAQVEPLIEPLPLGEES